MTKTTNQGRLGRNNRFSLFFCLLLAPACNSVHIEEQREFARLGRGVKLLRAADNTKKEELLEDLGAIPCKRLCDYKELCVNAYRSQVASLALLKEARELVALGGTRDTEAFALLARAQKELAAAREEAKTCISQEGALDRRLGR